MNKLQLLGLCMSMSSSLISMERMDVSLPDRFSEQQLKKICASVIRQIVKDRVSFHQVKREITNLRLLCPVIANVINNLMDSQFIPNLVAEINQQSDSCISSYQAYKMLMTAEQFVEFKRTHVQDVTYAHEQGYKLLNGIDMPHEEVQELIKKGAYLDIKSNDQFGDGLLSKAIHQRCSTLVAQLIQAGADVNIQSHDGNTPLMAAAAFCSVPIVRMLLDAQVHVNVQNHSGSTALMHAVQLFVSQDNVAIIKTLLVNGADPNIKDENGSTALIRAVLFDKFLDQSQVIRVLLAAGADQTMQDNVGKSAQDYINQ